MFVTVTNGSPLACKLILVWKSTWPTGDSGCNNHNSDGLLLSHFWVKASNRYGQTRRKNRMLLGAGRVTGDVPGMLFHTMTGVNEVVP